MKLGIIITTYQRPNGSTPSVLKRALESIKNQTHQDFFLIIIGDKYNNNSEFEYLCTLYEELKDKTYYENLPFAKERNKYPIGSKELWSSGGTYAYNYGIDIALNHGVDYVCHLDHDDYWHPQHLEIIDYVINESQDASIIYTCSTYFNSILPQVELKNTIELSEVNPGQVIHSAVCINHKHIPFKYRDVYEETGKECASDADFWMRANSYMKENNLKTYLATTLTCFHPTETSFNPSIENNIIPRGKHTYGPEPLILGSWEAAKGSSIGKFCSIADNLQFIIKGSHMIDWITTYPFQPMWNMNVPLHDLPLYAPITIGNDVWIASNVKIKQGVTIGDGAVLATECFVTKDVPPYAIVGGNPAKIIRYRFTEKQRNELLKIRWWDWEDEEIKKVVPLLVSNNIDEFIKIANNK